MDIKVTSLVKAMNILECFTLKVPELGVTEIAKQTGLPKSTVHNILHTFARMGYVAKNPRTNRFSLGHNLLRFSYVLTNQLGLSQRLLPYMKKVSQETHENVYLGIPSGGDVLYLDSCEDASCMVSRNILGERAPMYCTGLGKAILAHLNNPLSRLATPLFPYTDATITDPQILLKELIQVRERGYAVDNMEHEYGVKCVALPIFGADQEIHCSISVSGPSLRFPSERIETIAKTMADILRDVQAQI